MYHLVFLINRNKGAVRYASDSPFDENQLLVIFALLICNAARGLACRLAGGLALAAATVFNGLCNIFGFNSLNSVHWYYLQDY
jgi:hypothetical protein